MARTDTTEGQALWKPRGTEEDSRFCEGDRHLRLACDNYEEVEIISMFPTFRRASHMTSSSAQMAQSPGIGLDKGRTRDRVTTSCLNTAVEAVTYTLQWLACHSETEISHAIILTDSMNMLKKKVEFGMVCPVWHAALLIH